MNPPIQGEMGIRQWLFNPFIRVAGGQALTVGIGVILVTAVVASVSRVRLDGLLDLHTVQNVSLMFSIVEGLVNWLVISVLLTAAALAFASSTVRLIDIAGTQALARAPQLLAVLVCALRGCGTHSMRWPNRFSAVSRLRALGLHTWEVRLLL